MKEIKYICDLCRTEWLNSPSPVTYGLTSSAVPNCGFRARRVNSSSGLSVKPVIFSVDVCNECETRIQSTYKGLRGCIIDARKEREKNTKDIPTPDLMEQFCQLLETLGFRREGGAE